MSHIGRKTSTIISCFILSIIICGLLPSFTTGFQYPKPFTVALSSSPDTLDPLASSEQSEVISQVCEGLYRYNYSSSEMEPIPQLAASMGTWNGNNLTVPLRQNVTFHNGEKLNASAVKWNFDRIQYSSGGLYDENGELVGLSVNRMTLASYFFVNGTQILNTTIIEDDYIVTFVLNIGRGLFETLLAIIATHIMLPDNDYAYGTKFNRFLQFDEKLIGTGPYELVECIIESHFAFKAYDDYYLKRPSNYIQNMVYLVESDFENHYRAILNEDLHWGTVFGDYKEEFDENVNLVEIPHRSYVMFYIQMNMVNMYEEVRKASALAYNYTHLIEERGNNRIYYAHTPIPEGMLYYNSSIEGIPYYNLTKARELILSCPEISLNISISGLNLENSTEEWRSVAEGSNPLVWYNFSGYSGLENHYYQLADNMKDIGIRIQMNSLYPIAYYQIPNPNKVTYAFDGWGFYINDPIRMMNNLFHSKGVNREFAQCNLWFCSDVFWIYNFFLLNDTLVDNWIELSYEETGESRRQLFNSIQERIVRDLVPCFYLYQRMYFIGFNKKFVNEFSVNDMLNPLEDWYWFNLQYYPPSFLNIYGKFFLWGGLGIVGLAGIVIVSISLGKYLVKRKKKR